MPKNKRPAEYSALEGGVGFGIEFVLGAVLTGVANYTIPGAKTASVGLNLLLTGSGGTGLLLALIGGIPLGVYMVGGLITTMTASSILGFLFRISHPLGFAGRIALSVPNGLLNAGHFLKGQFDIFRGNRREWASYWTQRRIFLGRSRLRVGVKRAGKHARTRATAWMSGRRRWPAGLEELKALKRLDRGSAANIGELPVALEVDQLHALSKRKLLAIVSAASVHEDMVRVYGEFVDAQDSLVSLEADIESAEKEELEAAVQKNTIEELSSPVIDRKIDGAITLLRDVLDQSATTGVDVRAKIQEAIGSLEDIQTERRRLADPSRGRDTVPLANKTLDEVAQLLVKIQPLRPRVRHSVKSVRIVPNPLGVAVGHLDPADVFKLDKALSDLQAALLEQTKMDKAFRDFDQAQQGRRNLQKQYDAIDVRVNGGEKAEGQGTGTREASLRDQVGELTDRWELGLKAVKDLNDVLTSAATTYCDPLRNTRRNRRSDLLKSATLDIDFHQHYPEIESGLKESSANIERCRRLIENSSRTLRDKKDLLEVRKAEVSASRRLETERRRHYEDVNRVRNHFQSRYSKVDPDKLETELTWAEEQFKTAHQLREAAQMQARDAEKRLREAYTFYDVWTAQHKFYQSWKNELDEALTQVQVRSHGWLAGNAQAVARRWYAWRAQRQKRTLADQRTSLFQRRWGRVRQSLATLEILSVRRATIQRLYPRKELVEWRLWRAHLGAEIKSLDNDLNAFQTWLKREESCCQKLDQDPSDRVYTWDG